MEPFMKLNNRNRGEAIAFLDGDLSHAMIMLYDIVNFGMDPGDTCVHGHYFGRWGDSGLVAIAAHFGLGSLFIWVEEEKYLEGMGDYIVEAGMIPNMIGGESSQVELLLSEIGGRLFDVQRVIKLYLMAVTEITAVPLTDRVELADMSMLDDLIEISRDFEVEQFGESSTSDEDNRFLHKRHIEGNSSLVIRSGGRVVSKADGLIVSGMGGQIIRVFTVPDQRSKGYAAACVGKLSSNVLMKGRAVYLEVKSDNKPAVRAYEKAGFKKIADRVFAIITPK